MLCTQPPLSYLLSTHINTHTHTYTPSYPPLSLIHTHKHTHTHTRTCSGCEGLEREGAHTPRLAGESPRSHDEPALGSRELDRILRLASSINQLGGEAGAVEGLDLSVGKAIDDALAGPRVGIVLLVGVGRRDLRICVCEIMVVCGCM